MLKCLPFIPIETMQWCKFHDITSTVRLTVRHGEQYFRCLAPLDYVDGLSSTNGLATLVVFVNVIDDNHTIPCLD